MKKRFLSLLLCLAMLCTLLVPTSFAANGTWSGSGTAADPYLIEDAADLTALATNVNNSTSTYRGQYFKLTADVTVSNWDPIGYDSSHFFLGDFDGGGHTVTINGVDLIAHSTVSTCYYGLFGYGYYTGSGSSAVRPKIHDVAVTGSYDVSGKTNTTYAGGIIGRSDGSVIVNCVSTMDITASDANSKGYAGGIAGYGTSTYTEMYNCYGSGALSAWRTGGVVGHINSGTYQYCFTTADALSGYLGGNSTGCYTAAEWTALTEAEKNAWVTAANENTAISAYTSVTDFWGIGSDGNPVHVTCEHQHAADTLGDVTFPTCTEKGYTTYTCILCGNFFKDDYVNALGHDLETQTTPATCTEKGSSMEICTRDGCGYTNTTVLPALGHAWGAGAVITEPTCTKDGVTTYTCTCDFEGCCGDQPATKTETVPALGHNYVDGVCSRCGALEAAFKTVTIGTGTSYSNSTPYNNYYSHSLVEMIYPASQIGAAGSITKLAFQVAAVGSFSPTSLKIYMGHTSKYIFSSASGWAAADDLTLVYEGSPTLGTALGWETITLDTEFEYNGKDNLVIVCSVSGHYTTSLKYYYTATSTVNNVLYRGNDNSATYADYTNTTTGGTLSEYLPNIQLVMSACPHANRSGEQRVEATCTADGYESFHCEDCGEDVYNVLPALGHEWDEGAVITEASCTKKGEMLYTCVRECCGEGTVTKTETIPALGHSYDANGICTRCGAKKPTVETVTIGTGTNNDRMYPPYCTYYYNALSEMIYTAEEVGSAGTITKLAFYVANTGSHTTDVKIYMGHTGKSAFSGTADWVAPNDLTLVYEGTPTLGTATGWETISLDTPFDYNGTDNLVIAVARTSGNTYSYYLSYYYTTSSGNTVLYRVYDSGGESYADYANTTLDGKLSTARPNVQLTVEICAHDSKSNVQRVEPTCTEDGYESFHCDDCGRDLVTVLPALGHIWGEGVVTTEPNCTEEGVLTYTCTRDGCGETKSEPIPAGGGHTWVDIEVIQEPTCAEEGIMLQECSVCHETQTVAIPATGKHNFVNGFCTVCGAKDEWDGVTTHQPETDADGVYLIQYCEELAWFRDAVNGGQYSISARLTRDINLGANTWASIGGTTVATAYTGTFDGGGYTVTLDSTGCQGLFAYVGKTGVVKNVVVSGSVANSMHTGGVAAYNYGTIDRCVNKAAVTGSGSSTLYVGGIVGYNYGDLRNCVNEGNVTANTSGTVYAGGIFGYSSYSASSVNGGNTWIENCYNWGAVSAATTSTYSAAYAGGIGGYWSNGSGYTRAMLNCYSTGAVSAASANSKTGGIVGGILTGSAYTAKTTLTNCWYLEGTASAAYVPSAAEYAAASDETTVGAKTDAELKSADFVNDDIVGYLLIDGGYPILAWQGTGSIVKGDVNDDGKINAIDAMLVLRAQAGYMTLTSAQNAAADVNGDGNINSMDAMLILQYSIGKITVF